MDVSLTHCCFSPSLPPPPKGNKLKNFKKQRILMEDFQCIEQRGISKLNMATFEEEFHSLKMLGKQHLECLSFSGHCAHEQLLPACAWLGSVTYL